MKPKKLDRFERLVGKIVREADYKPDIYHDDVVELLRQQHRWVMRIVQKEKREIKDLAERIDPAHTVSRACLESRVAQCEDILTRLTQRAK